MLGVFGPGPAVPLSVADLKDGDGGVVDIPSTWRAAVKRSDAESETVEITTENQRWARDGNVGNVRRAQRGSGTSRRCPRTTHRRATDAIGSKRGGVALTRCPDDLLIVYRYPYTLAASSSTPLHGVPFPARLESLHPRT